MKLDTKTLSYMIFTVPGTANIVASGTAVSLSQLKLKAKAALKLAGASFSEEHRDRHVETGSVTTTLVDVTAPVLALPTEAPTPAPEDKK